MNSYVKRIIIEPLMRENIDAWNKTINVYCFHGLPLIVVKFNGDNTMNIWDYKFRPLENIFNFSEENIMIDYINQTFDIILIKEIKMLSAQLAQHFKFVRVDWMIYKNKVYFEELTFTPYSGMGGIKNKHNKELGKLLRLDKQNGI